MAVVVEVEVAIKPPKKTINSLQLLNKMIIMKLTLHLVREEAKAEEAKAEVEEITLSSIRSKINKEMQPISKRESKKEKDLKAKTQTNYLALSLVAKNLKEFGVRKWIRVRARIKQPEIWVVPHNF